jgi:hypothetical protein
MNPKTTKRRTPTIKAALAASRRRIRGRALLDHLKIPSIPNKVKQYKLYGNTLDRKTGLQRRVISEVSNPPSKNETGAESLGVNQIIMTLPKEMRHKVYIIFTRSLQPKGFVLLPTTDPREGCPLSPDLTLSSNGLVTNYLSRSASKTGKGGKLMYAYAEIRGGRISIARRGRT